MAITATQRTDIVKVVVGLFNAAPGAIYLNNFTAYAGNTAGLTNDLIADPAFTSIYPSFLTSLEFGTKFIDALVGNAAAAADKQWAAEWIAGQLDAGSSRAEVVTLAVTELQGAAGSAKWGAAATQFANKVAVAEYYSVNMLGSATDVGLLQGVVGSVTATTDVSTPAAREAAVSATPAGTTGQTFMLTKGLDNVPGTAGNDTIIGSISATAGDDLDTLSTLDIVNGGAGTDTLKIASAVAAIRLPNMTNVEIVEVEGAAGVTVDTSTTAGVTNLNVTKAAGAVVATAAATTDVGVSVKGIAGTTVQVDGGKDVTINTTDAAAAIDAGATGADVTGAVTITATGAKAANANAAVSLGNISVGGGTTVNVTQKATSDASGLVAGAAATTHTQGNVTVTAGATTTAVTLKQDAAVTAASTAAVTGVTEVASVKFTKLDAGESVTISGLTFTAAAGKNLTADQVAAAFANLSASAIKPTDVTPTTATGDTNGGSASANGTFTGALLADWTSGAATGDTVVFTGKANTAMTDLLASAKATVTTTTQGVTAVTAANTLGVVNGTVTIAGAAALKTVTVDGYAVSTGAAGITGGTNNALDTISLANGAGFEVDSAAATLGLTLANVNGTVNVAAGTKTLNAAVSHAKATETSTLASASAETVNVTGTGNVAGTTATGGLTAATAINTTGMTAGNATFTIANGTTTSYTGGAGKDAVTVSNANVAITKAIDLGAGDDTLTLNVVTGTVAVPTIDLKGGEGVDTIAMNGESAAALSANGTFAGKIEGFEKLSITDKVTVARTVNMANMDGITYVVSNNASASATVVGSKQSFSFDIAGLQIDTGAALSAGGALLYTATADDTAAAAIIAAGLATPVTINGVSYAVTTAGTVVTLTSVANVAPQPAISVAVAGAVDTAITNAGVTTTAGVADVAGGTSFLTIDKMANNGTLELVGSGDGVVVKMADATGSTDSFNIVTKVAGDLSFGTVDVAGVETLKLNAVDTTPGTAAAPTINTASLTVKADKATSLTIEGNSNVTLTLDATTTKLATIDAGTLTGNLIAGNSHAGVNTIAMTITGGKGADQLKASVGTNAKADVLNGGDGNDTLYAGSNGAKLSGGDGNDLFIVTANSATVGNKESNTYSEILDFKAGDLLQLQASNTAGTAAIDVTAFTKLAASLNETTAVFSDFVNAAIKEAGAGAATWFNYKGDAYVVIDSATDSTGDVFKNGEDLIVKLTGINGDNLSWNSDFATVALI